MGLKTKTQYILILALLVMQSCKSDDTIVDEIDQPVKKTNPIVQELKPDLNKVTPDQTTPVFNEDSAYVFIQNQVDFGGTRLSEWSKI